MNAIKKPPQVIKNPPKKKINIKELNIGEEPSQEKPSVLQSLAFYLLFGALAVTPLIIMFNDFADH